MDLDPAGFHLEIRRKSREPKTTAHLEPEKAFHLPAVWRAVFGPIGQWDFLFYALFGVIITSSVRVAGILQVFSFLIVPAIVSSYFFKSIKSELLKFDLIQDKCDLLEEFNIGDTLKVEFNLKGRKWTDPSGNDKYFNTLQAWRLSPVSSGIEPLDSTKPNSRPSAETVSYTHLTLPTNREV